jgi:transcription antitermination factor NusG
MDGGMAWVVAMTGGNCERKVLRQMAGWPLLPYLPFYLGWRARPVMLFRNYIFVNYVEETFNLLFRVPDIIRVLMNNGKPSLLGDKVIDSIKSRENHNGFVILPERPKKIFKEGQTLKVTQYGPLYGQFVIYKGMTPSDREQVLMNLLGREIETDFEQNELVAVKSEASCHLH